MLSVIELPIFTKAVKKLLSEEEKQDLHKALIDNPEGGVVMQKTGGVRKMRFAYGSQGKSGGLRVIYYYVSVKGKIYLIFAYPKNEQDNITDKQKKAYRKLTKILDGEEQ